ncbi:MAG: hypothetical protein AB7H93_17080 [Vicinamibacterales bacterium]
MGSSDALAAHIEAVTGALADGAPPPAAAAAALAATTDVLTLGALADDARRARHGGTATFVRVHEVTVDDVASRGAVPYAAAEVRIGGRPATLAAAVDAVRRARTLAGDRPVRGFWLADLAALGAGAFAAVAAAGLDGIAFVAPGAGAADAVAEARAAGLAVDVVGLEQAPADRLAWLVETRRLADAAGRIRAVAPLPRQLDRTAPTTGFDDVRTVALARLLVGAVPSVQVDWARYGPKLAQVALGVGADDLDAVSAVDEPALGPRRAAAEDVRRNIAAAGLSAVERDGRWAVRGR